MITPDVRAERAVALDEALSLYGSVGWTAYTEHPDVLAEALANSHLVLTVRADGVLVGLARTISDGSSVCFVQDLLVRPAFQRRGVGRALMVELLERYRQCRQFVLITERGDPTATAFYRAIGLRDGEGSGTAVFVKFS